MTSPWLVPLKQLRVGHTGQQAAKRDQGNRERQPAGSATSERATRDRVHRFRTILFDMNAVALRLRPVPAWRNTSALMRRLRFSFRRPVELMRSLSVRLAPLAPDSSAVVWPSSLPFLPLPDAHRHAAIRLAGEREVELDGATAHLARRLSRGRCWCCRPGPSWRTHRSRLRRRLRRRMRPRHQDCRPTIPTRGARAGTARRTRRRCRHPAHPLPPWPV